MNDFIDGEFEEIDNSIVPLGESTSSISSDLLPHNSENDTNTVDGTFEDITLKTKQIEVAARKIVSDAKKLLGGRIIDRFSGDVEFDVDDEYQRKAIIEFAKGDPTIKIITKGNTIIIAKPTSDFKNKYKEEGYEVVDSETSLDESLDKPKSGGLLNFAKGIGKNLARISYSVRFMERKADKMRMFGEYESINKERSGILPELRKNTLGRMRDFFSAYTASDFIPIGYQETEADKSAKTENGNRVLKIGKFIDLKNDEKASYYLNKALKETGLAKGGLFDLSEEGAFQNFFTSFRNMYLTKNIFETVYDTLAVGIDLGRLALISTGIGGTASEGMTFLSNYARVAPLATPAITAINRYVNRELSGADIRYALSVGGFSGFVTGMVGNALFQTPGLGAMAGRAGLSLASIGLLTVFDNQFSPKRQDIKSMRSRLLMESFSTASALAALANQRILKKVFDDVKNGIENVNSGLNGTNSNISTEVVSDAQGNPQKITTQVVDYITGNTNNTLNATLVPVEGHSGYFRIEGQQGTPYVWTLEEIQSGKASNQIPQQIIRGSEIMKYIDGEYVSSSTDPTITSREVRVVSNGQGGFTADNIHEVEINAQGRPYLPNGYNMGDLNDLELGEGWSKYVKGGDLYVIDKDGNVFIPNNPYPGAELVEIRGTAIPREIILENQAVASANPGAVIPEELRNGIPPKYITETVSAQSGVDNFIERAREAGRDLVKVDTDFGEGWIDTDPNGRFRVRNGLKVNDLVTGVWDNRGRLIGIRVEDTGGGSTGRINFYRATNGPVVNGNAIFNVQQYLPGQPNNTQTVVWEIGVEQRGGILRLDDLTDRSNGQQLWNSGLNSPEANDFIGRGKTTKQVINPEYVELERKYGAEYLQNLSQQQQFGGQFNPQGSPNQGGAGYVWNENGQFGVIEDVLGPIGGWTSDTLENMVDQFNNLPENQKVPVALALMAFIAGGVYVTGRRLDPREEAKARRQLDRILKNIDVSTLTPADLQTYQRLQAKLLSNKPLNAVERKEFKELSPAGIASKTWNRIWNGSSITQTKNELQQARDLMIGLPLTPEQRAAYEGNIDQLSKLVERGKLKNSQRVALQQISNNLGNQRKEINSALKVSLEEMKRKLDSTDESKVGADPGGMSVIIGDYLDKLNDPNEILDVDQRNYIQNTLESEVKKILKRESEFDTLQNQAKRFSNIEDKVNKSNPDTLAKLDRVRMKLNSNQPLDDDELKVLQELEIEVSDKESYEETRKTHQENIDTLLAELDSTLLSQNPDLNARLVELKKKATKTQLSEDELKELRDARSKNFAFKATKAKGDDVSIEINKLRNSPLFLNLAISNPNILDSIAAIELAIENGTVTDTQILELQKIHNQVLQEQINKVNGLELKYLAKATGDAMKEVRKASSTKIFKEDDLKIIEAANNTIQRNKKIVNEVSDSLTFLTSDKQLMVDEILQKIETATAVGSDFNELKIYSDEANIIQKVQLSLFDVEELYLESDADKEEYKKLKDKSAKELLSDSDKTRIEQLRVQVRNYENNLDRVTKRFKYYQTSLKRVEIKEDFESLIDKSKTQRLTSEEIKQLEKYSRAAQLDHEVEQINEQIGEFKHIKIAGFDSFAIDFPAELLININNSGANLTRKRNMVNSYRSEYLKELRNLNNKLTDKNEDNLDKIKKDAEEKAKRFVIAKFNII